MLLPASAPLPQPTTASSFSLISLNVLLPNSHDGWWIYKYYPPSVAAAETTWSARSRLLEELLLIADADIICLQECCAASFESDFSFLQRAGYAASLLGKGRMRPATLWKTSRFALCDAAGAPAPPPPETPPHETTTDAEGPAAAGHDGGGAADAEECEWAALPATRGVAVTQGDRTLITTLHLLGEDGSPRGTPPLFVVNCHLTAGQEARRRLSQVHDALDRVRKQRAKALPKGHDPRAPCVVCGDFNSQGSTAVRELLLRGEVLPSFRESGDPTERDQAGTALTSKPKRQGVGAFTDVYERVEGGCGPTLVAPTLQPLMQREDGGVTDLLRAALAEAFLTLSADGETLSLEEQRRWLVAVNKEEGRGSEWRAAAAAREVRGSDSLDLHAFVGVYEAEVAQGKFWGVEHDLRVLRGEGVAQHGAPPFTATFDYLYCSDAIEVLGVRAPLDRGEPRAEALLKGESWLPNEWHASDHLPVGAALAFAPKRSGSE